MFSIDLLVLTFIKSFEDAYKLDLCTENKSILETIRSSSDILRHYSSSKQKSIIVITNSLHTFQFSELISEV